MVKISNESLRSRAGRARKEIKDGAAISEEESLKLFGHFYTTPVDDYSGLGAYRATLKYYKGWGFKNDEVPAEVVAASMYALGVIAGKRAERSKARIAAGAACYIEELSKDFDLFTLVFQGLEQDLKENGYANAKRVANGMLALWERMSGHVTEAEQAAGIYRN